MEPAVWTNDAKMALALQIVAREVADVTEDELRGNVVQLQALLPDLVPGPHAKHADIARVAARLRTAADNLVVLREELPDVNVSRLVAQQPLPLLMAAPEELRVDVRQVKELLAACGPAGRRQLLEQHPQLLRPAAAAALLDEIARLFGLARGGAGGGAAGGGSGGSGGVGTARARAAALLGSSPDLAGAADCLRSQARGDRDPEYLADTTRASASG